MTPEQFAYWLQGFAGLNTEPPTSDQWQLIREHLQTVFKKVTPPLNHPMPVFSPELGKPPMPNFPKTDIGMPPYLPTIIC